MEQIIFDLEMLRQPSAPLTFLTGKGAETDEGDSIVYKIKEVMEANKNILALAAPQIGINKRIFCMKFNDQIKTFINPIITKKKGLNIIVETCASMPGKEVVIGVSLPRRRTRPLSILSIPVKWIIWMLTEKAYISVRSSVSRES
jgi:peptide deformylase